MNQSDQPRSGLSAAGIEPTSAVRRRWLYGAVAGAATLAGLGLAWRENHNEIESATGTPALWDMRFDAPGKPPVYMRTFAGKPLLLNFWATWCPPCVEEFPLLDRFYQENIHNGWQVLGLAVDQAPAVELFLQRVPVRFPVALAGLAGIALSKTLGNVGGGLPFSVVLGASGNVLRRKIGQVNTQDLAHWIALK